VLEYKQECTPTEESIAMPLPLSEGHLAAIIQSLTRHASIGKQAAILLQEPLPTRHDALLDAHYALHARLIDMIAIALDRVSPDTLHWLEQLPGDELPQHIIATGPNSTLDMLALTLLDYLPDDPAATRTLAIAFARLCEEASGLLSRRSAPLGRGFEDLFDERLKRRFALLPDTEGWLTALHQYALILYEEPEAAYDTIAATTGLPINDTLSAWLDVERRAGILRIVRQHKAENGHIRWFVRPDTAHKIVLDRLGVEGHWLIIGAGADSSSLARIGTAVERVVQPPRLMDRAMLSVSDVKSQESGWNLVTFGPSNSQETNYHTIPIQHTYMLNRTLMQETDPLLLRRMIRSTVREESSSDYMALDDHQRVQNALLTKIMNASTYAFTLYEEDNILVLDQGSNNCDKHRIASLPTESSAMDVQEFLRRIDRLSDVAPVQDRLGDAPQHPAASWARAYLARPRATTDVDIRLVYIPATIQHQLGGVPTVGTAFLADRLARQGLRTDVLRIAPAEFDTRLVELLAADVIGIGAYIHNCADVAELVRRLRAAGFAGYIILGGPEVRNIDAVQSGVTGWDAIIRGEAEEVLPEVIDILREFQRGNAKKALERASTLKGVALRLGDAVLLCETSARNRADTIICPLPINWSHGKRKRKLKMNFTRGCPYQCVFCPNHQGRRFRAGPVAELWRYSVLAVADDLKLPAIISEKAARAILNEFNIDAPPSLPEALALLWRDPPSTSILRRAIAELSPFIDPHVRADAALFNESIALPIPLDDRLASLPIDVMPIWEAQATWLLAKASVLASRTLWRREGSHPNELAALAEVALPPFILETSEDNTLVNRAEIIEYLQRRIAYDLAGDFIFNPGQNTIWDLTPHDHSGRADEDFIANLAAQNSFAVALGADGTSNTILRQNRKPLYGVTDLLAVNRALTKATTAEITNNYILLTPETSLLEAIESFLLFLLLPISWRDYDTPDFKAINLQVVKEETTLSTDEGLVFAPDDTGWNCPLRFPEVQALLDRWSLTSMVASAEIRPLLWRILAEDDIARAQIPLVVERWERDIDGEPELVALATLIHRATKPDGDLLSALRQVDILVHTRAFVEGRTLATFRELAAMV
jgi:hypothetical protein